MTTERYQVSLYAENLPNMGGLFRRSSPYAKVKIISGQSSGKEFETEVIEKCLDPDWYKIFLVDFAETEITNMEVTVFDYRDGREPLYMGECRFELGGVYQAPGKTKSQTIGRNDKSKLFCHVEKSRLGNAVGSFSIHLRGLDMKNVEPGAFGLGRSDPFFEISKKDADHAVAHQKWNVVCRSEHIDNNLNPYWQKQIIGLEELCYGRLDWPLKIEVFDHNNNGQHVPIGAFETTVLDLQEKIAIKGNADREKAVPIGKEGKDKRYGLVCILDATVKQESGVTNV